MDNTSSEQCSTVQYSTVEHSTVLCTGGTWDNGGGGVVAVQAAPLRHHTGHCRETRDSGPPTPPTLLTPHTQLRNTEEGTDLGACVGLLQV